MQGLRQGAATGQVNPVAARARELGLDREGLLTQFGSVAKFKRAQGLGTKVREPAAAPRIGVPPPKIGPRPQPKPPRRVPRGPKVRRPRPFPIG